MKNIIISIVVIAILVFAGYMISRSGSSDSKEGSDKTTPTVTQDVVEKDMYAVDTTASTVTWKGSFIVGGKSESGSILLKSGTGRIENGAINTGVFIFDMTSIKDVNSNATLENHLKNDDFFNVEMYPESKFELNSLTTATVQDMFTATGKLTVRDVTKDISFPIKLTVENDNSIRAVGTITFNRADFNVKYGSSSFFKNLGDKVISDKVELTVNLITKPIEVSAPPSSI